MFFSKSIFYYSTWTTNRVYVIRVRDSRQRQGLCEGRVCSGERGHCAYVCVRLCVCAHVCALRIRFSHGRARMRVCMRTTHTTPPRTQETAPRTAPYDRQTGVMCTAQGPRVDVPLGVPSGTPRSSAPQSPNAQPPGNKAQRASRPAMTCREAGPTNRHQEAQGGAEIRRGVAMGP